jgi:cobyrinic acid a,c-diamide synthase
VILETTKDHPWRSTDAALAGAALHAHEFHYSEIVSLPDDTSYAYTVKRGHGIDGEHDGILRHRMLASYTHLRATAGCDWPAKFVDYVRKTRNPDFKEVQACSL